jgi:hypothetical protein
MIMLAPATTANWDHEETVANQLHIPTYMTPLELHSLLCRKVEVPP